MKSNSTTIIAVLLVLVLAATTATAQERATRKWIDQITLPQSNFSAEVKAEMQTVANRLKQPCIAGSSPTMVSHPHGSEWTDACGVGLIGSVTRTCAHGQAIVKSISCQRDPTNCGTHKNGETWNGACGASLLGDITYQCQSGNTVINSSNCKLANTCVDNSAYQVSCPAGMSGNIAYTCISNTLVMGANNCQTINADCSGHGHGSTWGGTCPNGLAGNVTYQCFNGTGAITHINCGSGAGNSCNGRADSTSWTDACPDGYDGKMTYKCFNGTAAITYMSCSASTFDTTIELNRAQVLAAARSKSGIYSANGVVPSQGAADVICGQQGEGVYALSGAWSTFTFSDASDETVLFWNGSAFRPTNAKDAYGSNATYLNSLSCARNKPVVFSLGEASQQ